MTDRGTKALRVTPDRFEVGPSSMQWAGDELIVDINEVSSPPLISRVRGQVRVRPSALTSVEMPLTEDGAHIWRPFAPTADIAVELEAPGWQWQGHGYFDANFGTRALEQDFSFWSWARYPVGSGSACFYDAERLDGSRLATAIQFDGAGHPTVMETPPPLTRFRRSLWAIRRETRADAGYVPRQVKNMLDAPFYSRSAVQTCVDGQETVGVHEALDLRRFRSPLIKPMLAVRVPRRAGWHR